MLIRRVRHRDLDLAERLAVIAPDELDDLALVGRMAGDARRRRELRHQLRHDLAVAARPASEELRERAARGFIELGRESEVEDHERLALVDEGP
jgi:hypothetical protein